MDIRERISEHNVYLVVDPALDEGLLEEKVGQALEGGVGILQVWDHWPDEIDTDGKRRLTERICGWARPYGAPVLINGEWPLMLATGLDGVHFDTMPQDMDRIRDDIGRDFIAGVTCGNDLEVVARAEAQGMDYISFCAMFPSPSAGSCEIVQPQTVRKARQMTDLPLFLSGGITPQNVDELKGLDFSGVAVISGILEADDPKAETANYKKALSGML